jgi:hypothetical protein
VRRKKSSGKSGKTAIKKARLKRTDGKNEDPTGKYEVVDKNAHDNLRDFED